MAVCLIIILLINDQLSYDKFQANRDSIYRLTHERAEGMNLGMATVPQPLAKEVQKRFVGMEDVVNFHRFAGEVVNEGKAIDVYGFLTDPSLFDLFSYKLKAGDPKTALNEPYSIVLRADIAEKFFKDEDPMGKSMDIGDLGIYKVTGVLEELPGKTHIRFDVFTSMSTAQSLHEIGKRHFGINNWENGSQTWTYFRLLDSYSIDQLDANLKNIEQEFYGEDSDLKPTFQTQAMTKIVPGPLYGNAIGDGLPNFFVLGLTILAALIMVCAAFNYTNLSAARAMSRTKEAN